MIQLFSPRNVDSAPQRGGKRRMALGHSRIRIIEEYFHLEEHDPQRRYEYIDGHVYALAGETADHGTVKSNI